MEYISIDSKDRTTDNNVEYSDETNLNQMSINNDVITIRHNNEYQDGEIKAISNFFYWDVLFNV